MGFITETVNYFNNIPASTWGTIGSYLAGSTLVATLLQGIKHKFSFAEAKKVVTFALGFLSFIVALSSAILSTQPQGPLAVGRSTGYLIAGAVFVHRFAVSPAYYKIVTGLTNLVKDARAYRATVAPVAAPAEPVGTAEVQQFQV